MGGQGGDEVKGVVALLLFSGNERMCCRGRGL
jgi:hypothetical protein